MFKCEEEFGSVATDVDELTETKSALFGVALLEALDATGGVHDALLAGIERMGERRNVDADDVVRDAVDVALLSRGHRRAADDFVITVDENGGEVLRMNVGFHGNTLVRARLELEGRAT